MNNAIDNGGIENILKSFVSGFLSNIQIRLALQQSFKFSHTKSTIIHYSSGFTLKSYLNYFNLPISPKLERQCVMVCRMIAPRGNISTAQHSISFRVYFVRNQIYAYHN